MKMKISRRGCLTGVGTFSATLMASGAPSAETVVRRFSRDEFSYAFRTYMPGKTIRLGMMGSDGHTDMIVRDLESLKNVSLLAWSDRPASASFPAGVRRYDAYEEMLEREELDVVGICLPYHRNAGAAVAAARKGIHIVMEKPVATTLADLELLGNTVKRQRVRLTALLGMRLEPRFRAIRKLVEEGAIGDPVLVSSQKSYKFGKSRPEFYRRKVTYGGTIPWVGIHAIDYMHYTTRLDYSRTAGFQGNFCHGGYPGVEDHAGVVFEMSNGGTAVLNIDFLRPEAAPSHGDDRLRIAGTTGVVEIRDGGTRVELIDATGARDIPLPESKPFFSDFVAELRGEGKHILGPEEPFEMSRVALLARDAAETGRVIEL